MGIGPTKISSKLDKELLKKKSLIKRNILNIKIQKLSIHEAYKKILHDLSKQKFKFVFPEK